MISFYTGGHLGDAVYQLYTVSKAGGGRFLIGPGQYERWGEKEWQALAPLVDYQEYIVDVKIHSDSNSLPEECFDFRTCVSGRPDPENFYERNHLSSRWPGNVNLKKRYFRGYFAENGMRWNLNHFKRNECWLKAPFGERIDIAIHLPVNRICRSFEEWNRLLHHLNKNYEIRLIGSDDMNVWSDFEITKTKDLLEAASMIYSAKLFIGSASCCYVIAEGLGRLRLVDIPLESEGTIPHDDSGWNIATWPTDLLIKRIEEILS